MAVRIVNDETTPDPGRQSVGRGSLSLVEGGGMKPAVATRDEAARFASGLEDNQLQCREMGHSWRPHSAKFDFKANAWDRQLQCARCHTGRVQVLSRSGSVLQNAYVYPEGYLHKGLGRLTGEGRDAVRLESIVRVAEGKVPRGVATHA